MICEYKLAFVGTEIVQPPSHKLQYICILHDKICYKSYKLYNINVQLFQYEKLLTIMPPPKKQILL